jgi:TonB family protein
MKFNIANPCSEDWDKMKIGLNSRHCDSCEKSVVDFTQRTREEILAYLLMHNKERVCGHIRKSQLDFSYNEIMFVINGMTQKQKKSNLPFYVLCAGAMMLASCNTTTTGEMSTGEVVPEIEVRQDADTIASVDSIKEAVIDVVGKLEIAQVDTPPPAVDPIPMVEPPPIMGEVMEGDIEIIEPDEILDGNMELEPELLAVEKEEVFRFVEVMPEFPGGMDALMKYIQRNIAYPEFEKDQNIQGTVVAEFIVTTEGTLENIRIIRPVKNSKYFNAEVIRVIKKMPNWKPGTQSGEPVKVRFNLPVTFKLY